MMKKLLLIFVGLAAMSYLQAQEGWIEKNSNLTVGNGIGQISVGMLDQTALWALPVDATGAIVDGFTRSLDGGQTWYPGTFNAGDGLSQLFAINSTTCWAVFNTGATQGLYKTENAGATWTKKGNAYGSSSFANILHFFNEDDGVAQGDPVGGYYEIYTTSNGGETWTRVPSINIPAPTSGEYGITGNYDAVGDHIWFGTNKGRIFHSADKGLHWTASLTTFGATTVVQPEFSDELNGMAFRSYLDLGLEPTLSITHDGGATWESVNVAGPMYARYITYVPGTTATFVGSASAEGENGISYTTDGGYTWAAITEGYDFMASVWLDNETGWAGSFARSSRSVGGMYIYDGPPLEAFEVPGIAFNPSEIVEQAEAGGVESQILTVSNTGGVDLVYSAHVVYVQPAKSAPQTILAAQPSPVRENGGSNVISTDPSYRPAAYNPPTDDFLLHYDGNNADAFSWGPNLPYTIVNAAMFPPELTLPHAGMMLTSVIMYFNMTGDDHRVRVYGPGNGSGPGEMLVDQPFTPTAESWTEVELDNPVYITGGELWIGYQYTQPVADMFIPGVDEGPNNINGDWISFDGVVWNHLTDYESNVNWNIRGMLTGEPVAQWLAISSDGGTIEAGGSDQITVTCDAADLAPGTYHAAIRFLSNDPDFPSVDVPVTFEVTESGSLQSVILDFEAQEDWSLTFDPWTTVDVDGSATYGIEGVEFPHAGEPMSFIAFNPATTEPSLADDPELQPHGGVRFGACMASASPTYENDDWLISPAVTLGMNSSLTFWVKTYVDDWGLERYNVLISTTDNNPASFTLISDPPYMEAPTDWTEMYYDLSAYDGQTVYVAIQGVTADAFIFMVDDISIDYWVGTPESEEVSFSVYPNPVVNEMNITSNTEMTRVEIFNQLGQKVFARDMNDLRYKVNAAEFNNGVYTIRITTESGVTTKKVTIN
ncbi:MAG: choice-of-anchor J domain-containing protein [Bacteroidales bacterium]|nr:choice-of-anchor J domain-containing protein [Bacteroidales bacterium]